MSECGILSEEIRALIEHLNYDFDNLFSGSSGTNNSTSTSNILLGLRLVKAYKIHGAEVNLLSGSIVKSMLKLQY